MAEDTGGDIRGFRIDMAVLTHDEAVRMGRKKGVAVFLTSHGQD